MEYSPEEGLLESECSWDIQLKKVRKAGGAEMRAVMWLQLRLQQIPQGALELWWPFRIIPNWGKGAGFLYHYCSQLLAQAFPPWEVVLCWARQFPIAEGNTRTETGVNHQQPILSEAGVWVSWRQKAMWPEHGSIRYEHLQAEKCTKRSDGTFKWHANKWGWLLSPTLENILYVLAFMRWAMFSSGGSVVK